MLPLMGQAAATSVTESEFLALPESNQPVELVDGEVIVAPSPSFWHQEVLSRVVAALRAWAGDRPDVTVAQAPLDVRFGPGRILQPDAMVFLERLGLDVETPLSRIPEICVEVLSSNRAYDRLTKRYLYAEGGVAEYWLVDPGGLVERRSQAGLASSEELREQLSTPLLPGFILDIPSLFVG